MRVVCLCNAASSCPWNRNWKHGVILTLTKCIFPNIIVSNQIQSSYVGLGNTDSCKSWRQENLRRDAFVVTALIHWLHYWVASWGQWGSWMEKKTSRLARRGRLNLAISPRGNCICSCIWASYQEVSAKIFNHHQKIQHTLLCHGCIGTGGRG